MLKNQSNMSYLRVSDKRLICILWNGIIHGIWICIKSSNNKKGERFCSMWFYPYGNGGQYIGKHELVNLVKELAKFVG